MPETMLEVQSLFAGYGSGDILQGVSFSVRRGEAAAIIGRNGVGKSTLMRSIIGLLPPKRGTIHFQAQDVTHLPANKRAALGIGYVPQDREIFPELTVAENLRMGEQILRGNADPRYDLVYRYFPILSKRRHQLGGTLSGGQQQMLAIGRALVGNPELLLLDEPSVGIQPSIIKEIGDILARLNAEEGVTFLLVEQNMGLIAQLAPHYAYAIDKGRIVAELTQDELQDRDLLVRYLAV